MAFTSENMKARYQPLVARCGHIIRRREGDTGPRKARRACVREPRKVELLH